MVLSNILHRLKALAAISSVGLIAQLVLGAVPRQGGVTPQPYGANFFSGMITVQGQPPPAGTQVIGCVADCVEIFDSKPVLTDADGSYVALELNPDDEDLVGRIISFHLVNQFDRIAAIKTRRFEGDLNFDSLDLTFTDPLPLFTPLPTASPPIPVTLSLVPETGLSTAVTGMGFAPDSLVILTSGGMTLGTVTTDGTGAFRLVIAAPSSVAGGYEITSTDETGTFRNVTLTVPDLTGPNGVDGVPGAQGLTGPGGVDGDRGSVRATGDDASLVLPVVAFPWRVWGS